MAENVASDTKVSGEVAVNTKAAEAALARLSRRAKQTKGDLAGMPRTGTPPTFPSETGLTPTPTVKTGPAANAIKPVPPVGGEPTTVTPPAQAPRVEKNPKPDGKTNPRFPRKPSKSFSPKPTTGFADSDLRKRFFAVEQGGGKFGGFNVGPSGFTLDRGAFLGLAGRSVGLFFVAAGLGKVAESLSSAGREAVKEALEGDMPFHVAIGTKAQKFADDALATLGDKASSAIKWIPSVGHSVAQLMRQGWGSIESSLGNAFGWGDEENAQHLRELQADIYGIEDSWQEFIGGETRVQRFNKNMNRWQRGRDQALHDAMKQAAQMTSQLGEKLQGLGFRGTLGDIEKDISKQVEDFAKAKAITDFLEKNPIPSYDSADVTVDDGSD